MRSGDALPVTSRACDRWEWDVALVALVACKLKPSVWRLEMPSGLPLSVPVLGFPVRATGQWVLTKGLHCGGCHEMMARAARLERLGSVMQWKFFVSELQDVQGSWHNVAKAAATLPLMKGPRGFIHGGAWWE